MSKATRDQITIEIYAEQDAAQVRGNALASGDDTLDKQVEDEILSRLDSGDVWAWATVEVRATFAGFSGSAYLGCCSYQDEADFRQAGGYYADMVCEALDELQRTLENAAVAMTRFGAARRKVEPKIAHVAQG